MGARLTLVGAGGAEIHADLESYLTPELRDLARTETNAWIKRLRLVAYDGVSMRARFEYRGESLWWFTELYLQKMRRLDAAVAAVLALEAARDAHAPARLVLSGAEAAAGEAAAAFGRQTGLPVEVRRAPPPPSRRWQGYMVGLTARLSRLRPAPRVALARSPRVAAFVHTAFWSLNALDGDVAQPQRERYIGPVLEAVASRVAQDDLFLVGVGPRRNFRARRWWDAVTPAAGARPPVVPIEMLAGRRALEGSLDLWRRRSDLAGALTTGDAIRAAAVYRGTDLWSILRRELEGVALVQWPWSARAMDEAGAALDAVAPRVALTYAEAGGWGRALVLEARRRGIRSIGLQHGFIYRHWLNYLHEPDEVHPEGTDGGCPLPDLTLVFDRYAAEHLAAAGRYPPGRVAVTGNARLDELSRGINGLDPGARAAIRARLGVAGDRRLAVLAAKFSEIREHLPPLVEAAEALPDVRLAIAPHPAETPDAYAPVLAGRTHTTVAPRDLSLVHLLAACDGLVTMNSTVAIDALSLNTPSLVIGLPNNLSPFVAAGVMLGTAGPQNVRAGLERLLYDRKSREDLAHAARAFTDRFAMRPDGRGAARSADEILGQGSS